MDVLKLTPNQVEETYRRGGMSEADLDRYITAWNADETKFTTAKWSGPRTWDAPGFLLLHNKP